MHGKDEGLPVMKNRSRNFKPLNPGFFLVFSFPPLTSLSFSPEGTVNGNGKEKDKEELYQDLRALRFFHLAFPLRQPRWKIICGWQR
jgi:hypothetical protein